MTIGGSSFRFNRSTGALIVESAGGGGPSVVEGDKEPSDAYPNPSDHVGTWALNGVWNVVTEAWARWPADEFNIPYVHISSGILTQDGGTAYLGNFLTGQTQNLNQHRVRGTADWWLTRGGYVAAIPPADLDGLVNSLATGVYNAAPPTLTDGQGAPLQLTSSGAVRVASVGTTTLGDAMTNPTDASNVAAYLAGYDRAAGNWERLDRADLTSTSYTVASSGVGLKCEASLMVNDSGTMRRCTGTSTGALNCSFGNPFTVSNVGASSILAPGTYPSSVSLPYHCVTGTSNGAWSRGGYTGDIAAASIHGIPNTLPAAAFRTADPSPAAGGAVVNGCTDRGGQHVTQLPPSASDTYVCPARVNAFDDDAVTIGGAVPVIVFSVTASNESGGRLFLQLHNKVAAVSPGDVPIWQMSLANQESFSLGEAAFTPQGLPFSNACQLVWSTTSGTYTAPASGTGCNSHVRYTT